MKDKKKIDMPLLFNQEIGEKGMTLIEILVAIFIFAIAMTTIFGSFQTVIGQVGIIEEKTAAYEMGKTCLNQILADIGGVHLTPTQNFSPPDISDDPDRHRIVGETASMDGGNFSSIRFSADAHLPFEGSTETGVAQIVYYARQTKNKGVVLCRSDMLYPYTPVEENEKDPVLCKNLIGFKLLYYDEEGAEYESWDSDSDEFGYATPRAIQITLTFGVESEALVLETMAFLPVFREKKET
jgi:general secretion pathway protein J